MSTPFLSPLSLLKWLAAVCLGSCLAACGGGGEDGEDGEGGGSFATSTNTATNGVTGQSLYAAYCAVCHGASYSPAQNYSSTLNAIARNRGNMGYLSATIQTAQANDIATYLTFGATGTTVLLPQSISFTSPGNQILGGAVTVLTATASSGQVITFTSSTPGVCSVNRAALELLAVGTCTLTASQMGNATFAAATPVSVPLEVTAAAGPALTAQTIDFPPPPVNLVFGSAVPALVATASSGLPVSFASVTKSVCSASGTTITLLKAGTCTVAANQPGNTSYAAASTVSNSFDVVATNAAAGKDAYNQMISGQSCSSCHGVPGSQPTSLILSAANADVVLNSAIVYNKGGMGVLTGRYTAQQIIDIAAYLATPNF